MEVLDLLDDNIANGSLESEVQNSRISFVKNKNFLILRQRLDEIEKDYLNAKLLMDKMSLTIETIVKENHDLKSKIPMLSFKAHKSYRAWQGVTTDGTNIYVTTDRDENFNLCNIISIYDMKGRFIKEKINAYIGKDSNQKFMSFGDCNIIDSKLYVTAYNFNDGGIPSISRVIEFSLDNLEILKETDIGDSTAECVVKYNNSYWVSYHDVQEVRQFDLNYNLIKKHKLQMPAGEDGGYQGFVWYDGCIYMNTHGANIYGLEDTGIIHRYFYDGANFHFVEAIKPPRYGTTQGLSEYNKLFYWNDRPDNSIVITNTLSESLIKTEPQNISKNQIVNLTLLNNWCNFDFNFDRGLKAVKDSFGKVHLQGIVAGGNLQTAICNIPKDYRPKFSKNFAVDSNGSFGRISIVGKNSGTPNMAGDVLLMSGSNQYVSLDGISYFTDF